MLKITHTAIITDNDFDDDDILECDICHTTDTPLYCTEYSDYSQTIRCAAHRTNTAQITLDALTALILSNDLDAAELLNDLQNCTNDDMHDFQLHFADTFQIALDHAQRMIDAIRSDIALFTDIALSLEICPMHTCDLQICIDDQIAECAAYHS